jgi:hypothetical protein
MNDPPQEADVKLGRASGFRDLAIFLVIFAVLLALSSRGMADFTGLLWWGLVLVGSIYLAWKGWRHRKSSRESQGPGGWGAVIPPKLWRWMIGED